MKRVFLITVALLVALAVNVIFFGSWPAWITWCLFAAIAAAMMRLYQAAVKPMSTLANGMDLVNGQDFNNRLVNVGQPDADRLVGMFNRMMDRIKEERQRKEETNLFLEQVIEASPSGIVILDYDGYVARWNPAASELLDLTDSSVGMNPADMDGELWHAVAAIAKGRSETVRLSDNRIFRVARRSFIDRGFVRSFVVIDSLTEDMHGAEKDAYGKVIRMMAHEVNNSMAGVKSLLETLSEMLAEDDAITEVIESCRERCVSMSSFITSYADVVKIPEPVLHPLELNAFIRRQLPFLEGLAASVRITLALCDGTAYVMADEVLLGQVLVNVVKNAVESAQAAGKDDPHVEIATSVSGMTTLTVADNGYGVSPDVAGKLFTPFFSTKRSGRGLGLMCVSEILRRHSARFSLSTSSADGLTRFKMHFNNL